MISYYQSLSIIYDCINKCHYYSRGVNVCVFDTLNMVSLETVVSSSNVPSFNNSAMDGYAVKFDDINNLNIDKKFTVIDRVEAGNIVKFDNINPMEAIEIMTGALLPKIFDTVIKFEDTIKNQTSFTVNKEIKFSDNVRYIGEDYKNGDTLFEKGDVVTKEKIMGAISIGKNKIKVYKRIKIYLICTGKEVVDSLKQTSCDDNSITNTNGPYLKLFFEFLGLDVIYLGVVTDCVNTFSKYVDTVLQKNDFALLVTTGAVSKGTADFIPSYLKMVNARLLFHGVNIKPGKPILFSKLNTKTYMFSLPGNPISSIVGARFFVYPFIRYILGLSLERPFYAKLVNQFCGKKKMDIFLKSFLFSKGNILYVKILDEQESFKISGLLEANCFVFLDKNDISKIGCMVKVYMFNLFYFENL